MNKYEQLIEHIINDEESKAKELFHKIVVEKSREIYESLMDEEELGNRNQVEDLVDEVVADEEGMHEADDELGDEFGGDIGGGELGGDELGDEFGGDDMGGIEGGDEGSVEDRVMDLEDALDELKAEFDALIAGEEGGEGEGDDESGTGSEEFGGADDYAGDEGADEVHEAAEGKSGSGNPFAKSGKSGSGKAESGKSGSGSAKGKSGSGKGPMTEAERIREYVEKVGDAGNKTEGGEVAKGGSASINKQSIVAGKNDMGGTTANIVKGGSEQSPDGQAPKGKAGGFLKGAQEVDVAKRNVNKVGGNKGAQNFYGDKAKAKPAEGSTTDGSVSVNKQSLEPGRK